MKCKRILLVLHLFGVASGYAQSRNDGDSTASHPVVESVVGYDTVQAVRQLFAAKRDGASYTANVGMLTVGVGGVFLLPTLAFVNLVGSLAGAKPDPGRVAAFSLQLTSPGLLITTFGVVKRIRYNRKREEAIILAYERGQPLPPALLRSLNKRYLRLNK